MGLTLLPLSSSIREEYMPAMRLALTAPMWPIASGGMDREGIHVVMKLMDSYCLTKDDYIALLDMTRIKAEGIAQQLRDPVRGCKVGSPGVDQLSAGVADRLGHQVCLHARLQRQGARRQERHHAAGVQEGAKKEVCCEGGGRGGRRDG